MYYQEQDQTPKPDQTESLTSAKFDQDLQDRFNEAMKMSDKVDALQGTLNTVLQTIVNSLDSDKSLTELLGTYDWWEIRDAMRDNGIHIPTARKTVTFKVQTSATVELELELPVTFDDNSSDINDFVDSYDLESQLVDAIQDSNDLSIDDFDIESVE